MRIALPIFLFLLMPGCGGGSSSDGSADTGRNVVVVLTDDVGYRDMVSNEAGTMENIAALAEDGTTFERAYAASRVCSPARFGLFSGQVPSRHGWYYNPLHSESMPLEIETVAERVRRVGVKTEFIGKWHLGEDSDHTPRDQGFDQFFGFRGGSHDYWIADQPGNGPESKLWRNGDRVVTSRQLTDEMFRQAADWIGEWSDDRGHLMVISTNAAHGPMQPTPKGLAPLGGSVDEPRSHYLGHVVDIDRGIGTVKKALERAGVDDRTTFIVTNDHGGKTSATDMLVQDGASAEPRRASGPLADNGVLRSGKGSLYEGGLRVPMIVSGGGVQEQEVEAPVSHLDIFPTIAEWYGAGVPGGLDGESLVPCLTGGECHDTGPYYYLEPKTDSVDQEQFADGQAAIVDWPWKLIDDRSAGETELYNLEDDPAEAMNRADGKPGVSSDMERQLTDYLSSNVQWEPAASRLLKKKYPEWYEDR